MAAKKKSRTNLTGRQQGQTSGGYFEQNRGKNPCHSSNDDGSHAGREQLPDPRSPLILETGATLAAGADMPCPYCGALPRNPSVDWAAIKDSHFKEILIRASLTVKLYPCGCIESHNREQHEQEIWTRRIKQAQIPPRYWSATLQPTGRSPYENQFIPICQEYLDRREPRWQMKQANRETAGKNRETAGKTGIGFMGSIGTGKTYYMCAVLLELMRSNHKCLFINLPEFYTRLKSNFGDDGTPEYSRLIEETKEIEVLGLDEVGQRKLSPWASEELYGIINYRYNHELATLYTTSKSVEELRSTISRDTVDRLYEMCTAWQVTGHSLRGRDG
ncbi:MAG: ATP-binding protein [bacterium]